MARAAQLDVEFTTSGIDTVNKAVDSLNIKLGAIGAGLMITGQQLTDRLTRPIMDFLSDAYMGAASLEQAMGKVDAVFGTSSGQIIEWSEGAARGFGTSQQAALDMAGTYAAIMQAQGMSIDQSAMYSQSLVELAADMSAFTDISIDRSQLALRAAITGEYESLKAFGIVLKAAEVEQEAMNIALEEGTGEVTEQHRQLARYNIIMRQTSAMHGQFEREADGASGSLAILRALWTDMTAQIGGVLLPIGTKVTTMLSGWVDRLMNLPAPVTATIVVIAALVAALGPLLSIVGMMAIGIAALPAAFAAVGAGATAFMAALVPLLPIIAAVTAAITALFAAYNANFLGFGDAVDWGLERLQEFGEYLFGIPEQKTVNFDIEALADVGFYDWQEMPDGSYKNADLDITASGGGIGYVDYVLDDSAPDGKTWTLHVDVDGDGKEDALKIIGSEKLPDGTFKMTVEAVDGTVYETWYDEKSNQTIYLNVETDTTEAEASMGRVQKQIQGIRDWFSKAKEEMNAILNADWDGLDWDSFLGFSKIVDGLTNDWWDFVDLVYAGEEKVLAGWDAMTSAIGSAWSSTTSKIGNAWEGIAGGIMSSWQSIRDGWDSLTGAIQSAWDSTTSEIAGIWDAFVSGGLMSGISAIGDSIEGILGGIQSMVETVVSAIDSVVQKATDGINGLINLANNVPFVDIGEVGGDEGDDYELDPDTMQPIDSEGSSPAPAVNQDPTLKWNAARSGGGGIGRMLAGATGAADLFNDALKKLNPEISRSNDVINKTASTVPMYTGATRDAESATGAMASGMGSSFGSMAASALTSFTSMRSTASSESLSMQGAVGGSVSGMASTVGLRMDAMALNAGLKMRGMASDTNTQTSNMNSFASSNASTMASTVGSRIGDMASTAGTNFGDMATEASTSGSQMSTGMTGWMLGAHAAMIMRLGMMVSTVRDTGSTGYDAGHYAGSMISRGFANGMLSYLGIIRGAANQMVAAAAQAVIAKAMISSPSRLFEGYGKFIGEGLEVGILGKIGDVGRAADRLIDTSMPSPALNTPIGRGGYGTTVNNYYQQDVKVMTSAEWEAYKQKSDRGNQAYNHLSDPDAHNYGGGD